MTNLPILRNLVKKLPAKTYENRRRFEPLGDAKNGPKNAKNIMQNNAKFSAKKTKFDVQKCDKWRENRREI
jgi:hypothetical protein